MKKMLFSAMALVAFTATSMAGEKETKKIQKTEVSSQEKLIVTLERDCNSERQVAYLSALGDGFSSSDASGMAYHIYFWCMKSKFELTPAI